MAVVSGESEGPSDDEDIFHASDDSDDEEVDIATNQDAAIPQGDGFLYDENLDEEDEAYVNQHLRGAQNPLQSAHSPKRPIVSKSLAIPMPYCRVRAVFAS